MSSIISTGLTLLRSAGDTSHNGFTPLRLRTWLSGTNLHYCASAYRSGMLNLHLYAYYTGDISVNEFILRF
jgi:hypothetical protein